MPLAIHSYREMIQYLGDQDPTTSHMLKGKQVLDVAWKRVVLTRDTRRHAIASSAAVGGRARCGQCLPPLRR